MKSSILYLCLGVAGLLTAACGGYDPVATCQTACAECSAEGTDCDAACSGAQNQYDEARADAETAGCLAEFDVVISCSSGGDLCDTSRCSTETSAYVDCIVEFCTANPDSAVCAP